MPSAVYLRVMSLGLFVALVFAVPLLLGAAVGRWWAAGVLAVLALAPAVWVVLSEESTAEDSLGVVLSLTLILFSAPAIIGAVVGVLLGRGLRGHRRERAEILR
jgi:hypothetical protein